MRDEYGGRYMNAYGVLRVPYLARPEYLSDAQVLGRELAARDLALVCCYVNGGKGIQIASTNSAQ